MFIKTVDYFRAIFDLNRVMPPLVLAGYKPLLTAISSEIRELLAL
jgi:hypothetical protein